VIDGSLSAKSESEGAASARARRAVPLRGPLLLLGICAYFVLTYNLANDTLYVQGLVLVAAVFGILAVSLDLVAGVAGLYSLGHAGLFAMGAYGTTILHNDHGWNLFALLPASMLGVGCVGLVLGSLSLRVSGLYFAITTFIFTLVVTVLASDLAITGGYGGLIGPIFPEFPSSLDWLGASLIWCCMIGLLAAILLSLGIRRSPLYAVLLAIRDAEPFAAAAGARTSLIKIGLFGVSAAMAGAAGWIFAFQGIVSPSQFDWTVSVNILVMVILGGINTTLGPVIGAAFITIFPAHVSMNPFWQEVLFGAIFVAMVILYPPGFMGAVHALARRALGVLRRTAPGVSPALPVVPTNGAAAAAAMAAATNSQDAGQLAVDCRGISFAYLRGAPVLRDVDFRVRKGSIHGLIGPNGSGKTTLVDIIAGRLKPMAGTIELDGKQLEGSGPPARAKSGFMRTFQAPVLVRELTTAQNVGVGLYTRTPHIIARSPLWQTLPRARRDGRRLRGVADEALRFVGAEQWSRTGVAQIPHGIQQLTQLAAACAPQPSAVILDEPLAGLAPSEVEHTAELLAQLKRAGVSVILIEHQPRFVFELCDEVTVLDAGEVVATGPAADVRDHARVREVYLGQ
jgi:branched-chain amino acid transport system permease protein